MAGKAFQRRWEPLPPPSPAPVSAPGTSACSPLEASSIPASPAAAVLWFFHLLSQPVKEIPKQPAAPSEPPTLRRGLRGAKLGVREGGREGQRETVKELGSVCVETFCGEPEPCGLPSDPGLGEFW